MGDPKGKLERLQAVAEAVPQYPGRKRAEEWVRPLVEPWAMRYSSTVVQRHLGYWLMWTQVPGGRAEIVDRGWMSRRTAYAAEADFRRIFGVPVEEFDPAQLPRFFGLDDASEATPDA